MTVVGRLHFNSEATINASFDSATVQQGRQRPMVLTVSLVPHDEAPTDDLVLFDLIEYSPMLRFSHTGAHARRRLISGLKSAGLLRSSHNPAAPLRLTIDVPVRGGTIAKGKAVLHLFEIDGGLVIGSASSVTMNLQKVVRARHGIPDTLVGLDGSRNFSKPTAECDVSDLEVQLETMGRCIDILRAAIISSLPGCEVAEERMLLRKAEVCHDLACSNAEDMARATCRVPPAGTRVGSQCDYPFTTETGRSPTWHFTTRKRGPVRKGYAKLRWLLRTELSCLHRDAIVLCEGFRHEAPFSFDGAVDLALEFYNAGGELCCLALDHVRQVAIGARTMHELLSALDGIRSIAERQRVGDGYCPSEQAAAEAQRVLAAILSDGIVHARGLRKGTKVRDELEKLIAPGGPLVRGASPGVYCLASDYGLALPGGTGSAREFRMDDEREE